MSCGTSENSLQILPGGGGGSKILRLNPYQVVPYFQGLDERNMIAQTRVLKLKPIQNGGHLC